MRNSLFGGVLLAVAITNPSQITFKATGGVNRLLASKLGDVVSVCDFELVCPSATNDNAAVAAALAAIPSNGGVLFFPAGTFKFNLLTTRGGIVVMGAGSGNINTGLGGTVFTAATASSPILQFGDGATTTSRGNAVRDVIMVGDGANATGDAIYLFGARDFTADNVAITAFGRDGVRIQCNTTSSSGIHLNHMAISGSKGANLRAEYCAGSFTSNITVTDSHFNDAAVASGGRSIYLDSLTVNLINTYLDLHDGVGIQMVKNFSGSPSIEADSVNFDNSDGSSATSMDVSAVYVAASRLASAINGCFRFNGNVVYSDATVNESASRGCATYQPWILNGQAYNSFGFPLDEADSAANAVKLSRLNATGGNTEALSLGGAALRLVGTVTFPLQLNGTSIWRDATSGVLRSRLANNPSGDHQGLQLWPKLNKPALVSGGTAAIDGAQGKVFYVTPVDNVNFTIGNPTNFGSSTATAEDITECIINTTGGGLGVATFAAQYRLAGAWVQPATGNRRCAGFRGDDTGTQVWHETWRSAADVPN